MDASITTLGRVAHTVSNISGDACTTIVVLRIEEAGLGQSTDGRLRTSGAARWAHTIGSTVATAHLVTEQDFTPANIPLTLVTMIPIGANKRAAMPLQKLRPLSLLPG